MQLLIDLNRDQVCFALVWRFITGCNNVEFIYHRGKCPQNIEGNPGINYQTCKE